MKDQNGRVALAGVLRRVGGAESGQVVDWLAKLERRARDAATDLRGNILLGCISAMHELVALAVCEAP